LSLSSSSPPLGSAPEGTLAMIRQLQEDLHVSQSPEVIACRTKEQIAIHKFIKSHVRDAEPGSLYISGSPGTGKSLSVKAVIRELQEKPQFMQKVNKIVEVCAMTLRSPASLYPVLLAKLSGKAEDGHLPPLEAARLLQARLIPEEPNAKDKMVVVVVDEVDGLLDKHQTILYRLFEWAQKVNSRLVLIGKPRPLVDKSLAHSPSRVSPPFPPLALPK
jgi:origin recognition complex subunit 1